MILNLVMTQQTRTYKLLNIVRPNLSLDKIQNLFKTIMSLTDEESQISQDINMINLSYKMDHNTQGYLVNTVLKISPERVRQIRSRLELNEDILRTMFILQSESNDILLDAASLEKAGSYITKRGKMMFPKYSSRAFKVHNSRNIKRLRYMGLLPYCNYYA